MSVLPARTTVMLTHPAPTRPDHSRALATAVSVVMVQPVRMSMSVEITRTTVVPTLPAPTRPDRSHARATAVSLAMV